MSDGLYPPTTNEMGRAHDEEAAAGSMGYPSDDFRMCRICLESDAPADDPLIAPCRCAGSMKWVHRKCLNEWRAQEKVPLAFSHCPQCKFQYRTELDEGEQKIKYVRLLLFVARDTIGLFVLLQACLAGLALICTRAIRRRRSRSSTPPRGPSRTPRFTSLSGHTT